MFNACPYYNENTNGCSIMEREERLVKHSVFTKCNGWWMNCITEKDFQHTARKLSGRKID